jgi:hypothetical protein
MNGTPGLMMGTVVLILRVWISGDVDFMVAV